MSRIVSSRTLGLLAVAALCCTSCSNRSQPSDPSARNAESDDRVVVRSFDVHWPPIDPATDPPAGARSLLGGQLRILPDSSDLTDPHLVIELSLQRDIDDESRRFWNSSLEYREYAWMKRVRVWDADRQWLYPNLPFLFKLHGMDRLERYGGWDSGHAVDNDYGAVLIRCYDATGTIEDLDTATDPLVSAAWRAPGMQEPARRTLTHRADSDAFIVHLAGESLPYRGRVKVWFVYGDFMNHRVPDSWPTEPDSDGGSLAFFCVDWQYSAGEPIVLSIAQRVPETTGFDWRNWVGRLEEETEPVGRARLETSPAAFNRAPQEAQIVSKITCQYRSG